MGKLKHLEKYSIYLSIIPILIVGGYIYRFGLNLPFWDQWQVVTLVMKDQQGTLSFRDFFAQANEHRPLFPRLIWIILSKFTRYNVTAELWVNFGIALLTFFFFIKATVRKWETEKVNWSPLLIVLMSLIVFNLGQYETWLQGVQTVMLLNMACTILGFFFLLKHDNNIYFVASLILGIIATFSMASGLIYWAIGIILLVITKTNKKKILFWLVISLTCILSFLVGWKPVFLDLKYLREHIFEYFIFVLSFIGSPINSSLRYAWICGILSLGVCIYCLISLVKNGNYKMYFPYFGIMLLVILSAMSISIGRINLGLEQSTVSRYQTITVWYWLSLIVLFQSTSLNWRYKIGFCLVIALAALNLMYRGYINGQIGIYQRILPSYNAIKLGNAPTEDMLLLIRPELDFIYPRLEFLSQQKLSIFGEPP